MADNERIHAPQTRFSWVIQGRSNGPNPLCDVDLFGETAAAVVPTVGSLVPNWVLIVPRRSVVSFAFLSSAERAQCLDLAHRVAARLSTEGNEIYAFEHGASRRGSITGCGTDQAHLHIAALNFDMIGAARAAERELHWADVTAIDPWKFIPATRDYYFVSNFSRAVAAHPEVPQSQFFRKIIARSIGAADEWDYRTHPHFENVATTTAVLRGDASLRTAAFVA